MVETLTDKNLALEEEIEKLQETVSDLVSQERFFALILHVGILLFILYLCNNAHFSNLL